MILLAVIQHNLQQFFASSLMDQEVRHVGNAMPVDCGSELLLNVSTDGPSVQ
jgi:hypothetical protein